MAKVLKIETKTCDLMQFLFMIYFTYIITDELFTVICTSFVKADK